MSNSKTKESEYTHEVTLNETVLNNYIRGICKVIGTDYQDKFDENTFEYKQIISLTEIIIDNPLVFPNVLESKEITPEIKE